ncbi:MAG: TonB-dependent receptor [Burkholderiales bacterium]|nr:TonB-dependent receptor [Burkholderiales bacterium]
MKYFKMKALVKAVSTSTFRISGVAGRTALIVGAGIAAESMLITPAFADEPRSQSESKSTSAAVNKGDALAASTSANADAEIATLATVVVTARKKLERAQDVPVSISAVNADTLIERNRLTIADYFSEIPGLNLLGGDRGTSEVSLRGLTSGTSSNPTTAFTIDDTPFGGGLMIPDLDPADLQRIEVLRGPQGTLYGANSLNGIIKYVTAVPSTTTFASRVQVDGSSAAHGGSGYGVRASVNIPVTTDTLGVRLSAFDRRDPGYIDEVRSGASATNTSETKGARLSVLLKPSSTLTVRASVLNQQTNADASSTIDAARTNIPLFGEFAHSRIPGTDGYNRTLNFVDLNIAKDFDAVRLTSVTSFGRIKYDSAQDATGTLLSLINGRFPNQGLGARYDLNVSSDQHTQELRLESPEDGKSQLDWRLGLFYKDQKTDQMSDLHAAKAATGETATTIPGFAYTEAGSKYIETAGFGTATYHFNDKFDVQAGMRSSRNKLETVGLSRGILVAPGLSSINSSDSSNTYLLTPQYKFSADLMAYGTAATGYRPGGPTSAVAAGAPRSYGPDQTTNFELGIKGDLLNRSFSFAAAVYHISWKDIQLNTRDANGISFIANGSGAKSEGLEASVVWVPQKGLKISGNAVYNNAALTESFPVGSSTSGKPGDRLPFSSRFTTSLFATQEFPLWGYKGYVGGGATFVGSRLGDFENVGVARVDLADYTTMDLQAGLRAKNWTLSLFAKNLTDVHAYTGSRVTGATERLFLIAPRIIGLSLTYSM